MKVELASHSLELFELKLNSGFYNTFIDIDSRPKTGEY